MNTVKPKLTILIGPPGSGKSTSINRDLDRVIISTDDELERIAREENTTYEKVFKTYYKKAKHICVTKFNEAIVACKDIVIDRTSMSVASRSEWFVHGYETIAIDFTDAYTVDELVDRCNNPDRTKKISREVINDMIGRYEPPTEDQFDQVIKVGKNAHISV